MLADAAQLHSRSAEAPPSKHRGKTRALTLDALDRRTTAYKKTRHFIVALERDLGGVEGITSAEGQLIQRAAVLAAMLADAETRWIAGEAMDTGAYCTIVNAQRRILNCLRLKRSAKAKTPKLDAYLAALTSVRKGRGE